MEHQVVRLISFSTKAASEIHKYTKQLCIELSLTPRVFLLTDCEAYTENLGIKN